MDPTQPKIDRVRRWSLTAALAVGLVLATVAFTRVADRPTECGTGDWPPFMLMVNLTERQSMDPDRVHPGWILWCNESHWTMHVASEIAGETGSASTRGEPNDVFPWFSPTLTPDEAWEALTGQSERRTVQPRNGRATLAYVARVAEGQLRMEFNEHGIPVRVRMPGDNGWFLDVHLSFSGRSLWSDDDVMNWPACSQPGQGGFLNEPQPCWNNSGVTRPDGACFQDLAKVTGLDLTLGCAL